MYEELIARIGKCLISQGTPYMIAGGIARILYGDSRPVTDIDVVLGLDTRCLNVLLFMAQEMRLKPIPDDPKSYVKQNLVLPALDERSGIRIDFIMVTSPYQEKAMQRAKKVRIKDIPVFLAAPEDLIMQLVIAGGPLDLEDARTIMKRNPQVDIPYIKYWLGRFDKNWGKGEFLAHFEHLVPGDSPSRPKYY